MTWHTPPNKKSACPSHTSLVGRMTIFKLPLSICRWPSSHAAITHFPPTAGRRWQSCRARPHSRPRQVELASAPISSEPPTSPHLHPFHIARYCLSAQRYLRYFIPRHRTLRSRIRHPPGAFDPGSTELCVVHCLISRAVYQFPLESFFLKRNHSTGPSIQDDIPQPRGILGRQVLDPPTAPIVRCLVLCLACSCFPCYPKGARPDFLKIATWIQRTAMDVERCCEFPLSSMLLNAVVPPT